MAERRYILRGGAVPPPSLLALESALNAAQRAAVETDAARVLILAGAGSGKTRTLTYRVARLIEKGCPPEGIVLVTFTNRAAREMVSRIEALLGGSKARRVRAGTFHALAYRALQRNARRLGYEPGFSIVDRQDQAEIMTAAISAADIDLGARRFPSGDQLVKLLSWAINSERRLSDAILAQAPHFAPLEPAIDRVVEVYAKKKLEMNVMDFDDLLLNWKALLATDDPAAEALRAEVQHVLVDEYQDTNQLQADLAELLALTHGRISVVGDDAQSIYAFRGARFDNILDFPRRAATEVHQLTTNYRSVAPVLNLANEIIARNPMQFPKVLEAVRRDGAAPVLVPARDPVQQAEFIAQRVLELRDEGVALGEQAVLYRAHSHSVELQIELARRDIPFVLRSGLRFFEQGHIKDALALLRVLANPADELSLRRVLGMVPGIGSKTEERIIAETRGALRSGTEPHFALAAPAFLASLPTRARPAFERLVRTLAIASEPARAAAPGRPGAVLRLVLGAPTALGTAEDAVLRSHLEATYPNAKERWLELEQLAEIANQHEALDEFLAEVALVSDFGVATPESSRKADEAIVLSTIHQAKGLEWRAVFIAGLSEGSFPHVHALETAEGEAEERRLLYVAVTRAMEQLYLCYPGSRFVGDHERVLLRPSRFITEHAAKAGLFEKWLLEPGPSR